MMTQKNIELQLQALELIEQKYGITPQLFIPGNDEDEGKVSQTQELEHTEKSSVVPLVKESPSTSSSNVTPSEKQVLVEVIK